MDFAFASFARNFLIIFFGTCLCNIVINAFPRIYKSKKSHSYSNAAAEQDSSNTEISSFKTAIALKKLK